MILRLKCTQILKINIRQTKEKLKIILYEQEVNNSRD